MRLLALTVCLQMVVVVLAQKKTRFQRLKEASDEGTTHTAPDPQAAKKKHMSRLLEAVESPEKLAFLQHVQKEGVDPLDIFSTVINSNTFQPLIDNVEMQHRLLEAMPQLAVVPAFKSIMSRQASDTDTAATFAQGLQDILEFAKVSSTKVKNPSEIYRSMEKVAKSDDPEIQDLWSRSGTDEQAYDAVQKMVMADYMPGVDSDVLRNIRDKASFDPLLAFPELAEFIDQDPYISEIMRAKRKEEGISRQ